MQAALTCILVLFWVTWVLLTLVPLTNGVQIPDAVPSSFAPMQLAPNTQKSAIQTADVLRIHKSNAYMSKWGASLYCNSGPPVHISLSSSDQEQHNLKSHYSMLGMCCSVHQTKKAKSFIKVTVLWGRACCNAGLGTDTHLQLLHKQLLHAMTHC